MRNAVSTVTSRTLKPARGAGTETPKSSSGNASRTNHKAKSFTEGGPRNYARRVQEAGRTAALFDL